MLSISEQDPHKPENQWDKLLAKYSIIWIWSVIVGLNSSLFFSFFNGRSGNFGVLSILIISCNGMAIIVSIFSWLQLFKVLQLVILPMLFNTNRPKQNYREVERSSSFNDLEDEKKRTTYLVKDTSYFIGRAFYFMIFAITLKFMAFLIEGIFSALNKY